MFGHFTLDNQIILYRKIFIMILKMTTSDKATVLENRSSLADNLLPSLRGVVFLGILLTATSCAITQPLVGIATTGGETYIGQLAFRHHAPDWLLYLRESLQKPNDQAP